MFTLLPFSLYTCACSAFTVYSFYYVSFCCWFCGGVSPACAFNCCLVLLCFFIFCLPCMWCLAFVSCFGPFSCVCIQVRVFFLFVCTLCCFVDVRLLFAECACVLCDRIIRDRGPGSYRFQSLSLSKSNPNTLICKFNTVKKHVLTIF